MNSYSGVNGTVTIREGKIEINLTKDGNPLQGESEALLTLQNIVNERMFNFEKEFQQRFRPNKETVYILPKDAVEKPTTNG